MVIATVCSCQRCGRIEGWKRVQDASGKLQGLSLCVHVKGPVRLLPPPLEVNSRPPTSHHHIIKFFFLLLYSHTHTHPLMENVVMEGVLESVVMECCVLSLSVGCNTHYFYCVYGLHWHIIQGDYITVLNYSVWVFRCHDV